MSRNAVEILDASQTRLDGLDADCRSPGHQVDILGLILYKRSNQRSKKI